MANESDEERLLSSTEADEEETDCGGKDMWTCLRHPCCICGGCCCCVLLTIFVLAAFVWLYDGAWGDFMFGHLPHSYGMDMLKIKLNGYTPSWCSENTRHPELNEGVDIAKYPGGWMPKAGGGWTGCEKKTDYPGIGSDSYMGNAYVKQEMAKLPRLQYEDKVWRGNELGFIILNAAYWPEEVAPRSIALGSSVKQHILLRPIFEKLVGSCDAGCAASLLASAAAFQNRTSIGKNDLIEWVHLELFKRMFPGKELPVPVDQFISTQASAVELATLTEFLPISGSATLTNLKSIFDCYRPLVDDLYGADLTSEDCSPSASCVDQVTAGLLDALLYAGGLSVPSGLATGLWVLYSDVSKYGDTFPKDADLGSFDPAAFFYESIRFFPPVVGLPWWTTWPERATDPSGNQYLDGHRKVLNLALAGMDPNAWGADADKFRVRNMSAYHENYVDFADFAKDASVAGGAMDRACPGKTLALEMGTAWFKAWRQSDWCLSGSPGYKQVTPFVDDFTLERCA